MSELLVELLSEEIPARMQMRAADDFRRLVTDALKEAGLAFERSEAHATPRRLALVVDGLPERQPDRIEERKGPRVGAPEKAVEGFLRAAGLQSLDQCERRQVGNAEFWFASRRIAGQPSVDVLPGIVAGAIGRIPWPKSMRWADTTARYVRPLQNVLAVLDGRPLPGGYDVGGSVGVLPFNATTVGHRFHAPSPFQVSGFADYRERLAAARVILDQAERRRLIADGLEARAAVEGLSVVPDEGLLDEVAGLVEWPVVLLGRIDEAFMEVPPEVLTTSMRTHQRYFALRRPDGRLAARFAVVANVEAADGGTAIVAGNERVLRARLADARFFWDQDRRTPLSDGLPALYQIVFHAKLGTLGAKVARNELLAAEIARHVPGADEAQVREAARLAKADLVSGMVGEFPELQGIMGRYYALREGLAPAVADAIGEHYAPQGPGDRCPTAPVSIAVALADKLDSLVGFFAIDEKPTGSRDPFALRRAALGIIRIVLENRLRLPLQDLIFKGYWSFEETVPGFAGQLSAGHRPKAVARELLGFFADRLEVHLREQGVRHDHIRAVFALGDEDDVVRLIARVDALARFLASEDGANLLVAYRRARNIVTIEEKKDGTSHGGPAGPDLFVQDEEATLHAALAAARERSAARLAEDDFAGAMAALAELRGPVDAFFEKVTVNAKEPELRANRLRLLSEIPTTMGVVADFALIEG